MNILSNINEFKNLKLEENDLTIIDIPSIEQLEKNKYIIQMTSKAIAEANSKVSILYSNIKPKEVYSSIINKKIEFDNISKLTTKERRLKLENYKNIMKSNLCLSYTTGTTTNEVIEKCTTLRDDKNVNLIIISDVERIKDLDNTDKQTFLEDLEKLSKQLNIKIILIL